MLIAYTTLDIKGEFHYHVSLNLDGFRQNYI